MFPGDSALITPSERKDFQRYKGKDKDKDKNTNKNKMRVRWCYVGRSLQPRSIIQDFRESIAVVQTHHTHTQSQYATSRRDIEYTRLGRGEGEAE
jgi:hypothetical protein